MMLGRRVARVEAVQLLEERRRIALALDIAPEAVTAELLVDVRRIRATLREDQQRHPRIADADGRVDVEPALRRLADELGLDPEAVLAEARQVIQRWRLAAGDSR